MEFGQKKFYRFFLPGFFKIFWPTVLGYAVDDRIRLAPKHRNRAGQLSDSQKTAARMRQRAFPSLLCNVLSHTVNGETNCIVIMCVSPSPFNGSETGFTVDFGERFSHLPANPVGEKDALNM